MRRPVPTLPLAALPLVVVALGPAAPAVAADAPPSTSSGVGAQVGELASVGRTAARAESGTARSEAGAVEVGGAPLVQGRTGGRSSGTGTASGSLLDSGDSLPVRAEVTPWRASSSTTSTKRSADASAALARVTVAGVPLSVTVLGSSSSADHTGARSSSRAESDGVDLVVRDQRLRVLHSETSSSREVASYLIGLNGTPVLGDDQVGDACALLLPPLLALSCLQADGGEGDAPSTARALLADPGPAALPDAVVAAASSTGGTGTTTSGGPGPGQPDPGQPGTTTPGLAAPSDDPEGGLPSTGSTPAVLVGLGAWLAAVGAWLRAAGRRGAGMLPV